MLHELLTSNRTELIKRCRAKVARRSSDIPADQGVPLFLSQLADTLRSEQSTGTRHTHDTEPTPVPTGPARRAALHVAQMLRRGYSFDQVVHDYADVCQAVTKLAIELKKPVTQEEFRTLHRCLDNAIAEVVTSYARGHNASMADKATTAEERSVTLTDEQLRLIDSAIQTFAAIKTGIVGLHGTTGEVHANALLELRNLTIASRPESRRR